MSEPFRFQVQTQDGVALLTFDHGRVNEMGSAQLDALEVLIAELQAGAVGALVTTSTKTTSRGTPIFQAGANVTERSGWSLEQVKAHVRRQRAILASLRQLPLFHVGLVGGAALGWGCEYCITCDYRIATPDAVFALPETGLGILPGAGGSSELAQLIGLPQALRLGMTGERIDAQEALRIGLVQEIVPDTEAGLARAKALAQRVARNSPTAVGAFKRATLAALGHGPAERMEIEARAYELCADSGEAAVGRENFGDIRKGVRPPWGPLQVFEP